jgi:hypothetical protein
MTKSPKVEFPKHLNKPCPICGSTDGKHYHYIKGRIVEPDGTDWITGKPLTYLTSPSDR